MHEYTDRPLARWTILGRRPTMGSPLGNRAPTRLIGRCPIPRWSSGIPFCRRRQRDGGPGDHESDSRQREPVRNRARRARGFSLAGNLAGHLAVSPPPGSVAGDVPSSPAEHQGAAVHQGQEDGGDHHDMPGYGPDRGPHRVRHLGDDLVGGGSCRAGRKDTAAAGCPPVAVAAFQPNRKARTAQTASVTGPAYLGMSLTVTRCALIEQGSTTAFRSLAVCCGCREQAT